MRTLIDIPAEDLARLDVLARRNKRSRAAEVRDAVKTHVRRTSGNEWIERGYGHWAGRTDIEDGLEYQLAIREDRASD